MVAGVFKPSLLSPFLGQFLLSGLEEWTRMQRSVLICCFLCLIWIKGINQGRQRETTHEGRVDEEQATGMRQWGI